MTTPVPEIDAAEARRRAEAGEAVLLDVREPGEWQAGHAPDAVHRPLGSLDLTEFAGRPVVAVCRSGGRSGQATAAMLGAGVDVVNMAGGMQAWAAGGAPVVRDDGAPGQVV